MRHHGIVLNFVTLSLVRIIAPFLVFITHNFQSPQKICSNADNLSIIEQQVLNARNCCANNRNYVFYTVFV